MGRVVAPGALDPVAVRALAREENFPVALRLLPKQRRAELLAVYDVVRTIDEVGDDPACDPGERAADLDALEADLCRVWTDGAPLHPVFAGLLPVVRVHRLEPTPFLSLLDANRLDQSVHRLATWDDLRDYCRLSADPVGRIILAIAGVRNESALVLSDDVCTALQVLEHCQDVAEDFRDRDRVYLPAEDLARFDVDVDSLGAPVASPGVRAVVRYEVDRALELLRSGAPLVGVLRGWARLAVAGYVAGGFATADALRAASYDVLSRTPRPRRRDVLRHFLRLVVRGR